MNTREIELKIPLVAGLSAGAQGRRNINITVDGRQLNRLNNFTIHDGEGKVCFNFTPSETTTSPSQIVTLVQPDPTWSEANIAPLIAQALTNESITPSTLATDANARGRLADEFMRLALADEVNW